MFALPCVMNAQLKVNSSGNVSVALSSPVTAADLSTSYNSGYNYNTNYCFGIHTDKRGSKFFNIGVSGRSMPLSSSSRSFGVQGIAAGGLSGYLYGVLGSLSTVSSNGAGVFGTILHDTGLWVNGRYAGYFDGATYVNGTLTASSVVIPSDTRLQENVSVVNDERHDAAALRNLLGLSVVKYSDKVPAAAGADTVTVAFAANEEKDVTHYGLVAKELQDAYPELVKEGQDGYLHINYIEMIPLLIQSIQELKAELDELKVKDDAGSATRRESGFSDSAVITPKSGAGSRVSPINAVLYQNTPNPFTAQTEIRFSLPTDAPQAFIYIFDMNGRMQKQIPVNASKNSVTINGYELSAGIYLYSLVVGGKEIDTKRMILSK